MSKYTSRLFLIILVLHLSLFVQQNISFAARLAGSVEEEHYLQFDKTNTVIDKLTGKPVKNAVVSIPAKGILVTTNQEGKFNLNANLTGPAILSIKADGYKPFSLTITEEKSRAPLTISITKETGKEIVIDADLHHLGDNIFSDGSANANDFLSTSSGSYYSKKFFIDKVDKNSNVVLRIGSIIGLDTEIARKLGQGTVRNGISTPTNVYLNFRKIGELKINGDNQEILIPTHLLIPGSLNEITIKTGRNLFSRTKVDYDDIEFINLVLEFK